MALDVIFLSSFDFHNTAGIAIDWDTPGTDTAVDTTLGVPRTGRGCLRITSAAFGPTKIFTAQAKLLMATAFNPNSALPSGTKANIMWLIDSGTNTQQVRLCYEPDASLSVYTGNDPFPTLLGQSAAGVLNVDGYNYIVCRAEIANSGSVRVNCNGVQVLDLVGVDTRGAGTPASADKWQLLCLGSNSCFHDDVALCSWTDPSDDLLTAPVIYAFVPASDSAPLAWTPSAGVTHFNLVNAVPQSVATFVSSDSAGDIDQYIHDFFTGENVPPIPGTFDVLACAHSMLAQLDAPGVHTLASDANGSVGAAEAMTTSLHYFTTLRTPGPVANLAQLAVTPFGPDLVS